MQIEEQWGHGVVSRVDAIARAFVYRVWVDDVVRWERRVLLVGRGSERRRLAAAWAQDAEAARLVRAACPGLSAVIAEETYICGCPVERKEGA